MVEPNPDLAVLRALREGDMSVSEATADKYRLGKREAVSPDMLSGDLPKKLMTLIDESGQLYDRILRLDTELFRGQAARPKGQDAAAQQRALLDAFGRK